MINRLILCFTLLFSTTYGIKAINVRDCGAIGDGKHIDSPAINSAIEKAALTGDTVIVPAGTFMCYSLHLRSNITLRLERGAVIKAAPVTKTDGYDEAEPNDSKYQDFGHSHWHNSLIWGEDLHDVTIEGEGLIDGTGVLSRGAARHAKTKRQANKALAMRDCRRVTVRGISFLECGHFAMLLTGVDDLLIEDVTADTNRDGFDIDCCERVVIRNCKVNTLNDDAIVLKCSYALGWPKPTENVLIENCHVSGYDIGSFLNGTLLTTVEKAPDGDGPTGRIKLGTESNGGFRRIKIKDCTFTHCRGLALETVDGAMMEDVDVSNIYMKDICNSPIYIRVGDRMRAPKGFHPSEARNIRISNVCAEDVDSRYACLIAGTEQQPVRDVRIDSLSVRFRGGMTLDDVAKQRGCNPFFFSERRSVTQRGEKNYPEPSAHGIQPAWGFSISHAEGIRITGSKLESLAFDERPALYMNDTDNISFANSFYINDGVTKQFP